MPATKNNNVLPEPFLLGQPVWHLEAENPIVRWKMGIVEEDPMEDSDKSRMARHSPEVDDPEWAKKGEGHGEWKRIDRKQMIDYAISNDHNWRRVAMVCGAGLGKTTNLKWLESRINRLDNARSMHLAVFMELHEFKGIFGEDRNRKSDELVNWLVNWLDLHKAGGTEEEWRYSVERMLSQGRVTFLLDSLDQSLDQATDPRRGVIPALKHLVTGRWSNCRVWVSGRPCAFRIPSVEMQEMAGNTPWQFLRIGPLDEPECRQLLETTKRPG